ncbi:hypothetical protein ATO21_05620 [Pediococcus acidilactici]|uniref:hypothetical protein n=1 Tax=Pediococcus acidilactici TaxID=1254 RepID=UPI00071AF176|nr:hypothetical protein [Pediococcus acidilactici]KSV56353.1 hypothetical protein ATO21_05620 [Pediococcus acidilactici]
MRWRFTNWKQNCKKKKRDKLAQLKVLISDTRDLINKEDSSTEDIEDQMKQVQELKKEIQDINTKLEALESLDESDDTPDDKPTGTPEGDDGKNTSTPAKSKKRSCYGS